jgi:protease II
MALTATPSRRLLDRSLSLVDRGFAFAIAHIRGGDDLGYQWFLDGKLTKRTNTFNDFVDVTKGLIAEGYAKAGRVAAQGGSAGGELMGAIVNQAPSSSALLLPMCRSSMSSTRCSTTRCR